jgi:hypothetical protein
MSNKFIKIKINLSNNIIKKKNKLKKNNKKITINIFPAKLNNMLKYFLCFLVLFTTFTEYFSVNSKYSWPFLKLHYNIGQLSLWTYITLYSPGVHCTMFLIYE